MLTRRDELFGDETNIKGLIEAREKALGHVEEAFEVAAPTGIPSGKS